jgi:hypothetical protein
MVENGGSRLKSSMTGDWGSMGSVRALPLLADSAAARIKTTRRLYFTHHR